MNPFSLLFSISAGSCHGLTRTLLLVPSLLADAGCNVGTTASCNTDVGDVGVSEVQELVDRPGNNHWYVVLRVAIDSFAIFSVRSGSQPLVHS